MNAVRTDFVLGCAVLLLACEISLAKYCTYSNQKCPEGQYCDLGASKCLLCKIVCDKNSLLKNEIQCNEKCPAFTHMLDDNAHIPNQPVDDTPQVRQSTTTPKAVMPDLTTTLRDGTNDEIEAPNLYLHAPLLYILVALVVAIVVLALVLIIAVIFYHAKHMTDSEKREKGDVEGNNNLKEVLLEK